jgi:hypothetical protein
MLATAMGERGGFRRSFVYIFVVCSWLCYRIAEQLSGHVCGGMRLVCDVDIAGAGLCELVLVCANFEVATFCHGGT